MTTMPLKLRREIEAEIDDIIGAAGHAGHAALIGDDATGWKASLTRNGQKIEGNALRLAEQTAAELMRKFRLAETTPLAFAIPLNRAGIVLRTVADVQTFYEQANEGREPPHHWLVVKDALDGAKQAPTDRAVWALNQYLQQAIACEGLLAP